MIKNRENYTSADGLVQIHTTREPRRWPPHGYPVVLVTLRPKVGTRVLPREDGSTEWMPRFSEIVALVLQLGLKLAEAPADKPEERRLYWERRNAQRHGRISQ